MAIKKIPCGGWLYDDEQITFEDGVMKVIGGGGISEAPIDGKQYARKDAEWSEVQSGGGAMVVNFTPTLVDDVLTLSADKTPAEVKSAMLSGAVVGTILFPFDTEISPIGCASLTPDLLIGFTINDINLQNISIRYMITCDESFTEWILHQD